jgi:hypothetical protein
MNFSKLLEKIIAMCHGKHTSGSVFLAQNVTHFPPQQTFSPERSPQKSLWAFNIEKNLEATKSAKMYVASHII